MSSYTMPFVTLFHWDVPQALENEYGGFLSHKIVHDFYEFAELCFWEFCDRVKCWITLDEPWSFAYGGSVMGSLNPGMGGPSPSLLQKVVALHKYRSFTSDKVLKMEILKSSSTPQALLGSRICLLCACESAGAKVVGLLLAPDLNHLLIRSLLIETSIGNAFL